MTDPLWLANYPENVQWDAEIPEGPLFAILDEAVERFPDNRAWTSSASATAMPSSATRWLYRRGGQGLRQAQDGAALEAGELKDFLVDKLGRHEMPKFVEFPRRAAEDDDRQAVEEGAGRQGGGRQRIRFRLIADRSTKWVGDGDMAQSRPANSRPL